MNKRLQKKQVLIAVVLLGACLISLFTYRYLIKPLIAPTRAPQETWMTIFVHGTFGTKLGLFSLFNVLKGQVDDTNYKRMTSHMRYDPYFHQLQPMLEPGLFAIKPTFTVPKTQNKPCVIPLAATYQALTDYIRPHQENQLFYTFGWSGLMSQQRRRKEAIRLYNMLVAEYMELKKRGITPKIRLIAHSHGGNVLLNLAGVDQLVKLGTKVPTKKDFPDDDHRSSMQELYKILSSLPTQSAAQQKQHQKKWDYKPVAAPFTIDELVLLGTPIQPETTPFFLSPFFKSIMNVYSDDDVIQSMDWVSTRRYYSEKRLPCLPAGSGKKPIVRQVRIMLNKPTHKKEQAPAPATNEPAEPSVIGTISTVWNTLFGDTKTKELADPNHKELWFMDWKGTDRTLQAQQYIKPLPYFVFIPLLQSLIAQHPSLHDIDIRLKFGKDKVSLISYEHDERKKKTKILLPQVLLKRLQQKAGDWQPEDVAPDKEMNILHRYSKMLSM